MANKQPLSRELEPSYFELQAYWGATKHMGGQKATNELITLCHITKHQHILDIGCGTGTTPTHLAEIHHTTVTALDINPKMIQWTKGKARKEHIADKVHLIVADAQTLPFKDNLFDAVICESVTVFLHDKQHGLNEYVRVTKPRGYVGLNEGTWRKTPPPTKLIQYMAGIFGPEAEFRISQEWENLLEISGLKDITVRTYEINLPKEVIYRFRQLDLKDFSRARYRFLALYITSPPFRRTIKERYTRGMPIRAFIEYLGYGIYVGRKLV
jgi:ubiquinone/menaquinone biosynthesis C-methylase UbiE